MLVAEGHDARLRVREGATADEMREAVRVLVERLGERQGTGRRRDIVVETVDGENAAASRYAGALREAGFRSTGTGMRHYSGFG